MHQYASMITMINDIRTTRDLIESAKNNQESAPVLFMGLLPYLALEIDAVYRQLETVGINLIDLKLTGCHQETLKKVRSKTKLYREKTKKNLSRLKDIRIEQHEVFSKPLKLNIFKKMNWFYDFGTYHHQNVFIGNSYLYIWYFDGFEKIMTDTTISEQAAENIQIFAEALGQFVGNIELATAEIAQYEMRCFNRVFPTVQLKDYNIGKMKTALFNDELDKDCTLLLFNLLCAVNFVTVYMKEILPETNSFYIRMKYIIYYFVASSLERLIRYTEQNKNLCTGISAYQDEIITQPSLKNIKFCNCMRHYGITEADLPADHINLSEPLVGLIQYHFNMDSQKFVRQLDGLLHRQTVLLSQWVLKRPGYR